MSNSVTIGLSIRPRAWAANIADGVYNDTQWITNMRHPLFNKLFHDDTDD
jgi:hypothetical protein